jgi:hypothetical protein
MMATLECQSRSMNSTDVGAIAETNAQYIANHEFDFATRAISENFTTGVYGSYAGCRENQKNSWIINQQYIASGKSIKSCISNDRILTHSADSAAPRPAYCGEFLKQVGNGTGKITATPRFDSALQSLESGGDGLPLRSKIGIGMGAGGFIILVLVFTIRL